MHHLTKEGKAILRETALFLAANPEKFDMGHVFAVHNPTTDEDDHPFINLSPCEFLDAFKEEGCGTVMCLAGAIGHAHLDLSQYSNNHSLVKAVTKLLTDGIYDEEIDRLFMAYPDPENGIKGVSSENVVEAVEAFIEKGIEGVEELLGESHESIYLF